MSQNVIDIVWNLGKNGLSTISLLQRVDGIYSVIYCCNDCVGRFDDQRNDQGTFDTDVADTSEFTATTVDLNQQLACVGRCGNPGLRSVFGGDGCTVPTSVQFGV